MKKILIGLTTCFNPSWRKSIEDLSRFGIEEIAIFPTILEKRERQEMYKLLENSSVKSIPQVHLKDDMDLSEAEYLIQQFKTQVFNTHSIITSHPTTVDYKYLKKNIFIENTDVIPTESELKEYGGICVDFAHWESSRVKYKAAYQNFLDLLKRHKIGCAYVSAVPFEANHLIKNLCDLDYMKKYLKYLPDIISIELVNPIKELIEVKKYLDKIINK
jgi:hypothetical protein